MLTIQKINTRTILKHQPIKAADLFQEGNRVMITAHEQMLAVIHDIAGLLVNKRIRPTAEMPAPFKHDNRRAALAQLDACRKPGESAADDDNAFCGHDFLSLLLNQISRAIFIRRFFDTVSRLRKTSNCAAGIDSRISRY